LSITAALLIGLGGTWLVIETSRLRARLAEALREGEAQRRSAQTQAQRIADLEAQYKQLAEERERLQAQLQAAKETTSPKSRAAPVLFALSLRAFRDSGGKEPRLLIIPRGAEEARLRIGLPGHEYPGYQVMLLTADGTEVFARKGLRPQAARNGHVVFVSVPARKFADGDNVISLSGIISAGEVETLGKVIVKVRRR
jgi:outer membrane murein-binding lipoprotein Lpp